MDWKHYAVCILCKKSFQCVACSKGLNCSLLEVCRHFLLVSHFKHVKVPFEEGAAIEFEFEPVTFCKDGKSNICKVTHYLTFLVNIQISSSYLLFYSFMQLMAAVKERMRDKKVSFYFQIFFFHVSHCDDYKGTVRLFDFKYSQNRKILSLKKDRFKHENTKIR